MSCTIAALPFALLWIASGIIATTTTKIPANNSSVEPNHEMRVPMEETVFQTAFTDKNLLIKTLEEHGGKILSASDIEVRFSVDNFTLNFFRNKTKEPFNLCIVHEQTADPENELKNIDCEYKLNVQEQTYLQLVDKIKEKNMEIEEEEVLEDNTIVLTINLD